MWFSLALVLCAAPDIDTLVLPVLPEKPAPTTSQRAFESAFDEAMAVSLFRKVPTASARAMVKSVGANADCAPTDTACASRVALLTDVAAVVLWRANKDGVLVSAVRADNQSARSQWLPPMTAPNEAAVVAVRLLDSLFPERAPTPALPPAKEVAASNPSPSPPAPAPVLTSPIPIEPAGAAWPTPVLLTGLSVFVLGGVTAAVVDQILLGQLEATKTGTPLPSNYGTLSTVFFVAGGASVAGVIFAGVGGVGALTD
jgi:hypothetical protein